jgi:Uma2 family endonuclease
VAALTHPLLTPAEFAALMDRAGWTAPMELIDGEVVVIPPTGGDASLAQTEVVRHIGAWQSRQGAAGRLLTDVFVRIGDAVLAPDVAWWVPGREPEIAVGAIDTVPDLVVEVLSPATRANDLGPKRRAYLKGGVREVWLVDPAERTGTIITAAEERRLRAAERLTSPLLPGLAIVVSDLFA